MNSNSNRKKVSTPNYRISAFSIAGLIIFNFFTSLYFDFKKESNYPDSSLEINKATSNAVPLSEGTLTNKNNSYSHTSSFAPEICNNLIDDDLDGLVDCADPDCLDCTTTCGDNDADTVGDWCDLDDDNDGLPDAQEAAGCYPSGNYIENILFLEDFGAGLTVSSSPFVKLCYEDGTNPCALGGTSVSIGEYTIADTPLKFNANADWSNLGDHTGDTNGRMLVMDASASPDTFYIRPIYGFIKNLEVTGSFWARNTIIAGTNIVQPNITASVVDEFGTVLNTISTGLLPEDETWYEFSISANPGIADSVFLILENNAVGGVGNDLTIDDISFSQFVCDTDDDGVANHVDLDSDNDGIYDVVEAGHGIGYTLGVLSGPVGTNGLIDVIETTTDSDTINFVIADSEASPDGLYDSCELDSDSDGCKDATEESISDLDDDGLAGIGVPIVNPTNGLVLSASYAAPTNNTWQNAIFVSNVCDTDNDNISPHVDLDDDNDGIPDLEEGCGMTTDIENTIGFGNNVSSTVFSLEGTSITYALSGTNEATLTAYDAGAQGSSIRFQSTTNTDGTLASTFSNPISAVYFKLTDFDNLEDFTVNVYDESNVLYDLTKEGVLSVGTLINQTGNQFIGTTSTYSGGADINGNDPAEDYLGSVIFYFPNKVSRIDLIYIQSENSSIRYIEPIFCSSDTDGDDVFDYLDLDSDNDGIYDVLEAGHGALFSGGVVTGTVGLNGWLDAAETITDSGIINYTISNSETTPDAIYDAYEVDADGDGCFDTAEESILDSDNDGTAGVGTPIVNASTGLVISIAYAIPTNNIWQNPQIGPCLSEICNDTIDNDGDGDTDCDDSDCNTAGIILNLPDTTACANSSVVSLSGASPLGGVFSGTGVSGTDFDVSIAGPGMHVITYTITHASGCDTSAVDSILVYPLIAVGLDLVDSVECVNSGVLTLNGGSPSGGVYSGTGVSGGNFNAIVAGLGMHEITYTYTDANDCIYTDTDSINVISLPSVNLTLTNDSDCVTDNSLALGGGTPAGGTYSGLGVTLTNFDASIAGAGVHEITYTYTDANGCENTATDDIVVFALPTVSLTLSDTEECVLNNTFVLSGGLPVGGTYSGTGVSGTNFDATVAGLGTHAITYSFTDGNSCTNTTTANIEVVPATTVSLTLGTDEACAASSVLTLSGGTPLGGTYSGTGVSGGNFNPFGAGAGTHNIFYTYTDANGCSNTAIDVITVHAVPSFSTVTPSSPTTCSGTDGNIVLTGAGGTGTYEFRLDSGTWQSSNSFTGLSAGSYNLYIRNDNGFCEVAYASNPVVIADPSSPVAVINLPAAGCVNGSNSFSATNAGAGATYNWNFGAGASPSTASGIGPHAVTYSTNGSKNVTLSVSLLGCVAGDSESFTVNALPSVSLTLVDDRECVTSTMLTLSGGSPGGGTYSGTAVSGTNFNAATATVGTHTITYTYTDANGCVNSATDNIEVLALPTVSLTLGTDEDCISSTVLTLSGGSPAGGTYSGTGVSGTNFDASAAGAGSHAITYTYTDTDGCINSATDVITVYGYPTINLVSSSDPTSCGGTEGTITITASGATGIFEYRLNTGTWQSSNVFTGLAAGNYNVSIRNSNDFCETAYVSNPIVLNDPPATIVTTAVISNYTGEDVSCVGSADGFATASGSGGTSPYTYVWSNGQTGDTLRNVIAGTYTVTATDAIGCQGTQTVSLNDPPPLGVTAVFTNVSCYGGFDGAIDVTATGGVGAYTYAWNDIEPIAFYPMDGSTNDISGNDHHAVSIDGTEAYSSDAVDGDFSFDFDGGTGIRYDDGVFLDESVFERTVTMSIKPTALSGKQMLFEEGGNTDGIVLYLKDEKLHGSIRSGGAQRNAFDMNFPVDGQWHQVGLVFDNGTLFLLIDGVVGTSYDTGFSSINISSSEQGGLGKSFRGNASQNGNSNGQGYEGLMDNVSIYDQALRLTQIADANTDNGDRTGLPAGDYKVYVYDLNGCIDSVTLTLTQPDSLALTANTTNVLCNGGSTGIIDLSIAGGTSPFTHAWSNGATSEDLSSLTIGSYDVTVTDANGCSVEGTYVVNEPLALTASATVTSSYNGYDVTCPGATDGNAIATPSGGMSPFTYAWSNGQNNANLVNVMAGTYAVTITDDNACTITTTVTLTDPPGITVSASVISSFGGQDISCVGAADGVARATASNGAAPYTYAWSNGQTGQDLINVVAGTYTVTATDRNGCSSATTVTLNNPPALNITTGVTSNYNGANVSCAGATDGSADASASGGIGPYTYAWSNGQIGTDITAIGGGNYTVTATDAFGCTTTETVTLTNPSNVNVSINVTSSFNGNELSCEGATDGAATANPTGGVGPYTFSWNNSATVANLSSVGAGTYTVTVSDANNCTAVASVSFMEPSALTFSMISSPPTDCGVDDGIVIITASGGVGTYEYSLDGVTYQSSNIFTGLAAGTYFGYVRNTFGTCIIGPKAIVVNVPEAPTIDNVTIINPTTNVSTDGGVLLTASGTGIAIEYSIDGTNWQSSNLFDLLSEGTYTIQIRYVGFNCTSSNVISLVAGGGVVGGGGETNYCSDDLSGVNFVEIYYIPFQEDHIKTALTTIFPDACTGSNVADPVQTYISIGAVEDGTVITYDHWEDGFEPNLSFPIQSTTEVWGDGDDSNGKPPGYALDYLNAADIIVLNNAVTSTTRQSVIDFDGGDKIGSRGNLAVTRLGWASGTTIFLAGALEVYPSTLWGTEYDIPVGPNTNINDLFEYTGAIVMATEDNTTVQIDSDGDNVFESSVVLNEGESHLINTGLSSGGKLSSDKAVQVHLITGDICQTYESRWFTLKPTDQWSDSYFNPVATPNDGGSTHVDFTNAPTYVHLYNPNSSSIQVRWETNAGYQGQVAVGAGGTNFIELPDNTGSHFYTNTGRNFYALASIDSDEFGNNARNDWGYALTPESSLSSQITLVGFAPGANPLITTTENSAPVWLTADYPTGSSSSGSITVCVDYNGNGGVLSDANGINYDATLVLNPLDNAKIYDPDGDQTSMRIWVCDGSDALIAGAWGQDPVNVTTEAEAIDLGVGLPNGIPFAASKCVDLSKDHNSNGLYDECDEIIYTLQIRNSGVLPLSTGSINIIDTLSSDLTYIENSTVTIVNDVVNSVPDDAGPSPFPLDETGFSYSSVIQPGDSIIIRFEASINDLASSRFIRNVAYVGNAQQKLFPEVSFPAEEPLGPILTGVPVDVTVECGNIPDVPTLGTEIYTINNCEEMDTIDQSLWTLRYVDSEESIGESAPATNAFDNNPNTYWHTDYSSTNPPHPHEIQIDLGAVYSITGFRYLPRQTGSNGLVASFEFYVSSDGTNWGTAKTAGTWSFGTSEKEEVFDISLGRYVRFVALSELGGNPWTSVAELDVLQCVNYAPETITYTQDSTQTNNGSATDNCYDITRTWEVTDYCGQVNTYIQNITVEDTADPVLVNVPSDITVTSATIPQAPVFNCSSPGNLALGMPTSQSSTSGSFASDYAVDGNTDGNIINNSVSETNSELEAWWEVDLQNVQPIEEIEIWNRTDCCDTRLSNYYVLISNQPFTSTDLSTCLLDPDVNAYFQSAVAGRPSTISVNTVGRYLRIQLQGTDRLHLAEVVVTPSCISATDNCDNEVSISYSEVNVPSGCTYDITRTWEATDNCGNTFSQSQVITVSSILEITADVTSDFNGQDISCSSATDGTASVTTIGGVAPISISWSNGQTLGNATGLSAGTYYVTVTDGNGCQAQDSVTLTVPPDILINANITSNHNGEDISCFGGNDGSAFVNASGGTGTITYAWSNGQNTASATGLIAGTYTVSATDANGCVATSTLTLNDPTPLSVSASITSDYNGEDISCPGLNDGEATATATGGTGVITYNWSNSQAGAVSANLIAGKYLVTATDANGCIAIDSVTLVDPTVITFSIASQTNPGFCEATDGTFSISTSGGLGTYEYRLGTTGTWQNSNTFSGLSAGAYDVYVRNSDGTCVVGPTTVTLSDPIPQSCPIIPAVDTLIYCNTDVSVILSVVASPDASGYTWTVPIGINLVSGAGTNSIELDMNEVAVGSYDICMVTNSNCGNSPVCCITLEIITCTEICNNGIDDDGDGNIDLADDECLDCDVVFNSDYDFLQRINPATDLAEDTLNALAFLNNADALGLDPISRRFYFLEEGSINPVISYIDPNTGNQINTGVTIPATANVPGLGFNISGVAYAISENGELFSITTNAGTTDIPSVGLLGNIGAATVGDLALDFDGNIWAVLNSNELYKIDPLIPAASLVGVLSELSNFGGNEIESVAFSGTDQLLVGASSQIYEVNIATGQAVLIGNLGATTHDFASCAFPVFATDLAVTKTVAQTGPVAPGDTLDYTITVTNTGAIIVTGSTLTDTIPGGTTYVPGSTTVNGNAVSDVAGEMPFVNGGEIHSDTYPSGNVVSGVDVVITFRVVIDCCPATAAISNQGFVDFDGASGPVPSDDPTLPGTSDPTDISVSTLAAPVITLAASNRTVDCNTASNPADLSNWLATNGGATATVSCGLVNWSNNFTSLSDLCGSTGIASVIFTATNDCGLSVSTTATYTIIDTIPPVWTTDPADITIECNGTADPRGEVSAWLAVFGGGAVNDLCGSVTVTDDYTALAATGCGTTGTATVIFTATDECSLTTTRTAILTIVDTTAPELSIVNDITVDCDIIPVPVAPVATDSCDALVDIVYDEVTVYHPSPSWKTSGSCSLIHTVSAANHDDKGTPGDTSDDEMTFTITLIGQNTGAGWSAVINGNPVNGEYYKTYQFGPFLSNGSVLNFSVSDDTDLSCTIPVTINAADF